MTDTLAISTMLQSKGLEVRQAEAIAKAIASANRAVANAPIKRVNHQNELDLIQMQFDLKMAIHSVKADLQKSVHDRQMAEIKWGAGVLVACFIAFIALANNANL